MKPRGPLDKPGAEWDAQAERLAWRLSAREGITFDEAKAKIAERAIRLGRSPGNLKFRRMIDRMMRRKGLPFGEAASLVWDRLARSVIRKGIDGVRSRLGEAPPDGLGIPPVSG